MRERARPPSKKAGNEMSEPEPFLPHFYPPKAKPQYSAKTRLHQHGLMMAGDETWILTQSVAIKLTQRISERSLKGWCEENGETSEKISLPSPQLNWNAKMTSWKLNDVLSFRVFHFQFFMNSLCNENERSSFQAYIYSNRLLIRRP